MLVGILGAAVVSVVAWLWWRLRRSHRRPTAAEIEFAAQVRLRRKRLAEPSLRLAPGGGDDDGFTKLGGLPGLPAGTNWPLGAAGPRAFLAQVDLAEANTAGGPDWLPSLGRLFFFYDRSRHGFADVVQVIYGLERSGEAPAPELAPQYGERFVDLCPIVSWPSLEWLGVDAVGLVRVEDEFSNGEDLEPIHRIGGYPDELQDERMSLSCELLACGLDPEGVHETTPAMERAVGDWRLLLQVDSDPGLGMDLGGGRLYVFVRRSDARNAIFSRTVSIWQST